VAEGPGRLLVALYCLFALAAGARASVQLARDVTLPYLVDPLSDETVWSGYGYVPLVLPLLGLAWFSTRARPGFSGR
jgi:hypothetical protein